MNLRDTRIEQAGVMRCCLASVASEYEGRDGECDVPVELGAKSRCQHCGVTFTLVLREGECPAWWTKQDWSRPVWRPDWMISI